MRAVSTNLKVTGGILRRRETWSLARLVHSCARHALLEMVNGALLYIGGRGCLR